MNRNLRLTVAYVIISHGKDVHYGNADCAMVWHYYKSTRAKPTVFENLIRRAAQEPFWALGSRIKKTMDTPFPWPSCDLLAQLICKRVMGKREPTSVEKWWLNGRSLARLRIEGGKVKRDASPKTAVRPL